MMTGEGSPLNGDQKKNSRSFAVVLVCSITLAFVITIALILSIKWGPQQMTRHVTVAAEDSRCSDVGISTLQAGGSAVDAAIAAMLCMSVVNPACSGLGGDGFMLIRNQRDKNDTVSLEFRSAAPLSATVQRVTKDSLSSVGLRVGVPGFVAGLKKAHFLHGQLNWDKLFSAAAALARNGAVVSATLATALQLAANDSQGWPRSGAAQRFVKDGQMLGAGQLLLMPELADALDQLARTDGDDFYSGRLASDLLQAVAAAGGQMNASDLTNYTAVNYTALELRLNSSTTVFGALPPSSSVSAMTALGVLDAFNLVAGAFDPTEATNYHRLIEALKLAFGAQATSLGDMGGPPNANNSMLNWAKRQLSTATLRDLRSKIKDSGIIANDPLAYGANYYLLPLRSSCSSSVVALDNNELLVSFTASLGAPFGARTWTPSGILLNDQMMDFTYDKTLTNSNLPPSPNNMVAPGRRPVSWLSPLIAVTTDRPCARRFTLATSQLSSSQPMATVSAAVLSAARLIWSPLNTTEAPRFLLHNGLWPDQLHVDQAAPQSLIDQLKLDHNSLSARSDVAAVAVAVKSNSSVTAFAGLASANSTAVVL